MARLLPIVQHDDWSADPKLCRRRPLAKPPRTQRYQQPRLLEKSRQVRGLDLGARLLRVQTTSCGLLLQGRVRR